MATVCPLGPPATSEYRVVYRRDLATIHHRAFGFHADACAPGILALLGPTLERQGTVLELGCGSGALTRHLLEAGHRVLATDASPAMVELAGEAQVLVLPDDPLPPADAVVSTGHVLNYLGDEAAVDRALAAIAGALRPGGVLAIDLLDRRYGEARRDAPPYARVEEDWALVTRYEAPAPHRFVRNITTFVATADGSWRRDDERHENVLVDTTAVPAVLAAHGVEARVSTSFGDEQLPDGLVAVIGRRL
jgi:SAM-dependent methyltransferase